MWTPRWWALVMIALLTAGGPAAGQDIAPARIAVLTTSFGLVPHVAGLREGLAALGYREGDDFVLQVRFTEGDQTSVERAVGAAIWSGADLIFAIGARPALAAREMTRRIPIVFAGVADPVGLGLIQTLDRPGANVTGVADREVEVGARRLEIFKDLVPGLRRVLYVHDANDAVSLALAAVYRDTGRRLGVEVLERPVSSEAEVDAVLRQVRRGDVQGIIGPPHSSFNVPGSVLDLAGRRRLPTLGGTTFWAEVGALVSYGASVHDAGRHAAHLVDRVLRGDDPARIPVHVNTRIELSVNEQTARTLGLAIAPDVLDHADRVFR